MEYIKIEKLWGRKDIEIYFNPDINIFIGKNGSGKTTLIRSIKSVLTCDLLDLIEIDFSEIQIRLKKGKKQRTIKVKKDLEENRLTYKISRERVDIPISVIHELGRERYRYKFHPPTERYYIQHLVEYIQNFLRKIVNVRWVSVYREIRDIGPIELREGRGNLVDNILEQLLIKLNNHLLSIQAKITEKYKEFEKKVVLLMLYDENYDSKFKIDTFVKSNLSDKKTKLIDAFKALNLYTREVDERIEKHFKKFEEAKKHWDMVERKVEDGLDITDLTVLPLMNRTETMIQLASNIDEEKKKLLSGITKFQRLLDNFIGDKTIRLNPDGELEITLNRPKKKIDVYKLSSGEGVVRLND